ncbi:hypothetical protein [Salinilacihabitans rarus]|uniref:hypothetical protein n=1 Tax=Salinilacihabitans rarus TaxID=2961596 RepID=UPI0020C86A28|nr:hypothetical protein [Salinilacihabitans rarus]
MFGKMQSGLTQLYAQNRGGVTDTGEYSARGISRTVYWFHDESKRMGDYSPFGTLLLNEQAKEDFSEDVVDYVFLHEVGHDQMGFIGRTLFWIFYLTFGLLLLAGIIALPRTLVAAFQFAPSTVMVPAYLVAGIGITVAAMLPFAAVCWIDETLAELFAISKIGRSQYRSVLDEVKEESDAGLIRRIRLRIQYPPESLILWIARKRGIGSQ